MHFTLVRKGVLLVLYRDQTLHQQNFTGRAYSETVCTAETKPYSSLAIGTDMSNYLLHLVVKYCCSQSTVTKSLAYPPKQVNGSITCLPSKGTKHLCSTFASVFITTREQLTLF